MCMFLIWELVCLIFWMNFCSLICGGWMVVWLRGLMVIVWLW